jgi:outer membrane protein assembly factor BamA
LKGQILLSVLFAQPVGQAVNGTLKIPAPDTTSNFHVAAIPFADTAIPSLSNDTTTDYVRLIHEKEDSLLYLMYKKENGNNLNNRTRTFYDSLRIKAENKRFTRELYHALFTDTARKAPPEKTLNLETFKMVQNKIIRKITIKRLDVFGPTIEDTTLITSNHIKKMGNELHISTHLRVIRKSLLFSEGDKLNPFLLFDNERLIRDLPYIQDVRFLIQESITPSDSVDVVILVKDVWPIGFGFELSDIQAGTFSLWHTNLLGFGHQFGAKLFYDNTKDQVFGTSLLYNDANILGSFIRGNLYFADRWNLNTYRLELNRNFIASGINWAGASIIEKTRTVQDLGMRDTSIENIHLDYWNYDLWVGRSFEVSSSTGLWPAKTNLFMAGRYMQINYLESPEASEDSLYRFQDKTQMLVSLGFSQQGFYRSNLIYSFGQTEDVPFGFLFKFTGGIEQAKYKYRPYFGFSASGGYNAGRLGYFYGQAEFGSFVFDHKLEQGAFHFLLKYFTDIEKINRFQFRHFITAEYLMGINRLPDEYVTLENRDGITGLGSRYLRGDEKKVIKLESDMFTPFQPLGFRFVFFAFADLGTIKGSLFTESNDRLYSGIGLGLRIRNERLVFNTIQLKFTWYTSMPEEASYHSFVASGEQRLQMQNFFMDKPQVIGY